MNNAITSTCSALAASPWDASASSAPTPLAPEPTYSDTFQPFKANELPVNKALHLAACPGAPAGVAQPGAANAQGTPTGPAPAGNTQPGATNAQGTPTGPAPAGVAQPGAANAQGTPTQTSTLPSDGDLGYQIAGGEVGAGAENDASDSLFSGHVDPIISAPRDEGTTPCYLRQGSTHAREHDNHPTAKNRTADGEVSCPSGLHRANATRTKTPVGELENIAADCELRQQDQLHAEEIFTRMRLERNLHIAKLQAMIANMQTEIQRIFEEVALRRQKVHDDLMAKWEKVMFA